MDEQIKQIAERLRGLRDALDLSVEEVASDCKLMVDEYRALESGESDLSVSLLQRIAHKYGITLDELMFGEEPKMKSYFLTRKGTGVSVERTKAYKYESLASGFKDRIADPFIVTVEPKPEGTAVRIFQYTRRTRVQLSDRRTPVVEYQRKRVDIESGRQLVFRFKQTTWHVGA